MGFGRSKKLQHQFKVISDDGSFEINAPDYNSGKLDWYSFDQYNISVLNEREFSTEFLTPINLTFPAMPKKRLFSFENNRVDLGNMDINPDDLIRVMMIDFSLFSGSDWYLIPLEMELGDAVWIKQAVVKDVFGVCTTIKNGPSAQGMIGPSLSEHQQNGRYTGLDIWDVFKIRDRNIPANEYNELQDFFYLVPSIVNTRESQTLEEVVFIRDEFSNMIWGIEKKVRNDLGKPVNGYDFHLEKNGSFLPRKGPAILSENQEELPAFKLASTVPYNWIPYKIKSLNTPGLLSQAYMVRYDENGDSIYDLKPIAYLTAEDLPEIREEAVPRSGIRVCITRQRVRNWNGRTFVWQGRKILPGRGEGDSGLRFDYLI